MHFSRRIFTTLLGVRISRCETLTLAHDVRPQSSTQVAKSSTKELTGTKFPSPPLRSPAQPCCLVQTVTHALVSAMVSLGPIRQAVAMCRSSAGSQMTPSATRYLTVRPRAAIATVRSCSDVPALLGRGSGPDVNLQPSGQCGGARWGRPCGGGRCSCKLATEGTVV